MTNEQEQAHSQAEPTAESPVEDQAEPVAPESEAAESAAAEAPPGQLGAGELSALLESARGEAAENWDKLVRARAELDNLRKRHERELEGARKYAIERFVGELLPVRDSLELGLSAAQGETADVAKLREGKELTLKLLTDVLGKFGIGEVDPQGQPFNPELHQAISMQPREDVPASTVVTVVQKGYTLNGRLVRPAMVIVSRTPD